MKISIIGSGALGKTYGGLLSLAGNDVHFLMRSEYDEIREKGFFEINFSKEEKKFKIENPKTYNHPAKLPASDLVIISLKSNENKNIASLLSTCLKENTIVLIIQNGIGNEEWISQFTHQCPIICGVSIIGAKRVSPTLVNISSKGEIRIAPYKMEHKAFCEVIKNAFSKIPISLPVKEVDNFKEIRWQKLVWNVPFSSLSVIYNQDVTILACVQPYASIVMNLINEITDIAKSEGVVISQDYIHKMLEATKQGEPYFPSMYDDFVQGKEIEKEYIIDNVLKIAKKNHISTPMLSLIESHLEKQL
ncbi:MAG: hypothetical protein BGO43_09630 [Gammaproteobacteria bacterium 39-13]|mgnify:CR=1 FL=1|nr:2-dehydropantoate 2-reductase [Gammaproteobacteria bacterium]OJV93900.1 MAG: hypothetical protein BGO43_09630 [Gammaproteobacteria bacterium 39-13]